MINMEDIVQGIFRLCVYKVTFTGGIVQYQRTPHTALCCRYSAFQNIRDILNVMQDYFCKLTKSTLVRMEEYEKEREHHCHCVEQVRQYVMCAADLSPLPAKFGRNYPDLENVHICRNFEADRDWVWERNNGSLAVPPRDQIINCDTLFLKLLSHLQASEYRTAEETSPSP